MDTGAADCGVMCTFIKELLEGHLKVGFLLVWQGGKIYLIYSKGGKTNLIVVKDLLQETRLTFDFESIYFPCVR